MLNGFSIPFVRLNISDSALRTSDIESKWIKRFVCMVAYYGIPSAKWIEKYRAYTEGHVAMTVTCSILTALYV